MCRSAVLWSGPWRDVSAPLADDNELVLALAARRDCELAAVREELAAIEESFAVDAAYLGSR